MNLPEGWVVPEGATPKDLGNCKTCGALILWVITKTGKRGPYDRDGVSHFATCPQGKEWTAKMKARRARPQSENPPRECPSCHQMHPVGTTCA